MSRKLTVMSRIGTLLTVLLAALWVAPIVIALQQVVSLEGLAETLSQMMALRWISNSLFTSVTITLLVLVLCAPCAYAFSKLNFPGKETLYWLFLAGLIVPREVLFVPQFILMDNLNAIDTYQGIILPQLVAPVAIVVFKRYFDRIDSALHDAATIEGAGEFHIFRRIYLPLNQGTTWALAIYVFIGAWNNFFWPFLVIYSEEMKTIAVGLAGNYSFVILAITVIIAAFVAFFAQYCIRPGNVKVEVAR